MDLIFPESMKAEKFADTLFTDIPVSDDTKMCVVIPARNEEQYIWACLDAFVHQTDLNGQPLNRALFEVLVLVNNSTDCSAEIVRDFQRRNTNLQLFMAEVTLPKPNANIGFIRKALKTVAYHRLRKQGDGLILTTDADTKVARDWLAQNQNEIDNGAEVVGGRILLRKDEFQSLDTGTQALYFLDEQYQFLQAELEAEIMGESHDPAPRHHQHFNGSFAITTDCYARSGGVPEVAHLEDCAFVERLQQVDARIRHSNRVKVYTSARCVGRACYGLSYQLNEWKNTCNNEWLVESGTSVFERLTLKKQLKNIWIRRHSATFDGKAELQKCLPDLFISPAKTEELFSSSYFGAFYQQVMQLRPEAVQPDLVPLETAIGQLQQISKHQSRASFCQTSSL